MNVLILPMQYCISSTNSGVIANEEICNSRAEFSVISRVKLRTSWSTYLNLKHILFRVWETYSIQRKESSLIKFWGMPTDGRSTSLFSFQVLSSKITNFFFALSNFRFGTECTFSSCIHGWEAANKRLLSKLTRSPSSSRLHQPTICSQSSGGNSLNS